jgi:tRNA G18 (ribose-2'-O)-methylase SpoU
MRKLKLDELGRLDRTGYQSADKIPITVILDNIRSGMNVGSFFRTSDAYRIEHIILCGITARPPHKEILKTAIGATDTVTWSYVKDVSEAVTQVRSDGYHIVGIEQTDESTRLAHYKVSTDKKYALVFGNEVNGLSAEVLPLLDECIEIAQYGTKYSLNVSVCGGVVLWHFATPYYL